MAYVSPALKKFWAGNQTLIAPDVAPKFRQAAIVGAIVTNDMAKAGVGILAGCDSMIADSCVPDELQLMVSGGMSPAAALQTATVNPARYFGLDGKAGSVAPGHWADVVLLDGDPLVDITNLRQVRAVILRGQLLEKEDLDKLRADVRVAAGQP
jgi:imidazolonepropionase-like amidohydrolase